METHCHDTKTPVERNTPPVGSFLPLVPHAPRNGQPPSAHADSSSPAQSTTVGETDRLSAVRGIWRQNFDQLEQWQQGELWKVLSDFMDILAHTDNEVGLTHLVQHEIDTGDARPFKTRPQRVPMASKKRSTKMRF